MSQSNPGGLRATLLACAGSLAVTLLVAACVSDTGDQSYKSELAAAGGDPDKLLIVNCLLPGQVRQLGTSATYLTARRPIKTTAAMCQIRGGEYVAYDRANIHTALRVWLPAAEAGDAKAQNYVGEIYEQGLGTKPDYAKAAEWYQKAAAQGFARAEANMGHLYEQGLGVPKNKVKALNLYREASGLTGDQLAFTTSINELKAQVKRSQQRAASAEQSASQLRNQLHRLQQQMQEQDRQQQSTERELQQARQRMVQQSRTNKPQPEVSAESETVRQLKQRLATQIAEKSRIQQQADLLQARLEAETKGADAVRQQLQKVEQQLTSSEQERQQLAASNNQLENQQAQRLDELRQTLAATRQALERQNQQLATQNTSQASELRQKLNASSNRIAQLEQRLAKAQTQQVDLAQQQADLAQARHDLEQTRQQLEQQRASLGARDNAQVAQLNAQLERQTQAMSQREQQIKALQQQLSVSNTKLAQTQGRIEALQSEAKAVRAALQTRTAVVNTNPPAESVPKEPLPSTEPKVDFGQYYALVIGDDKYAELPDLQTAVDDARAVTEVLRNRYGFKVQLLLNATRAQILTALNSYRAKLTRDDNFLLYYAGHGVLDRPNERGNWLPVDASPNNTTNWIPNNEITDILNVMDAKHVMVIADSCYSGTLTRSLTTSVEAGRTPAEQLRWLKLMAKVRSRTVLTSGGLQPVLDGGGNGHSIFARQLLQVLSDNNKILESPLLYEAVATRVEKAAARLGVNQTPQYGPIKFAGDVGAPFLFRPTNLQMAAAGS